MPIPNTPTHWNIPYQRNPFFTGREDVLAALHRQLHMENAVALSHPQGICGLGGIGKTQTALEYAYRYRSNYHAVFWVRADSVPSLTSSLVELASVLDLPERNKKDQEVIVQSVLRWLRLHPDWLLIYDSMDNLSIAESFLPKAGPGHLLFTTRARAVGGLASRLDIEKMEPDIGALLLLRRAGMIALKALLDVANPDEQSIARAISEELDGLPLALDQAGAYIKEAPCPLPEYLPLYQTRRRDILGVRGSFNQDYPASVATTWSLSFEKVSQTNAAATELLNFCAFLAPDVIPEEIVSQGASYLGPVLHPVAAHPVHLDRSIAALLAYSLVDRDANDATLSVHRLVQAVVRDALPVEVGKQWMQRAVCAVDTTFPDVEFAQWSTCERWLPHALACASWIKHEQMAFPMGTHLLNQTGYYLVERAQYKEAEPLLKHALLIREQQLGKTHPDTALSLNNLASLYSEQGKYVEAEQMYQRALGIEEQQLGKTHPDTASSLNNLGILYYRQGKHTEAEQMYRRALGIEEQQLGKTHPDTVQTLSNLAVLYKAQGKYKEAESFYGRTLTIREQQLGETHPDTILSLNNLAELYRVQGKYAEAEPLYRRALEINEKQLGVDHLKTASSLSNLALLYNHQGRYADAEPLFRQALSIREQQLGEWHPDTAQSLNNLSLLYYNQGKFTDAEPLFLRALSIREQQLGLLHPHTAQSLSNLAELYRAQEKNREAEALFRRALSIQEQQLGEHPDTAQTLNNLALLYLNQGKYEDAMPLYQRALSTYEQQLGEMHPDTAQILDNLATLHYAQGKYREAELLLKRVLLIREQQLGEIHPNTAQSLDNLAVFYLSQGKYMQAEPLYRRVLSIKEQQLGTDHHETLLVRRNYTALLQAIGRGKNTMPEKDLRTVGQELHNLANICRQEGNFTEAIVLEQTAMHVDKQQVGEGLFGVGAALNNLGLVFAGQKMPTVAELLYKRALHIHEQQGEQTNPNIPITLKNLADLYYVQQRYEETALFLQRALDWNEQHLGIEHSDTLRTLEHLVMTYYLLHKYEEAATLYLRTPVEPQVQRGASSESLKQPAQGESEHITWITVLNNLAAYSYTQRRFLEAESLGQRALALCERYREMTSPITATTLSNLAVICDALGKDDEVTQLFKRAEVIRQQQLL
jgi:tetratricopeptide (TPR) repeat protein